MVVVLTEDSSNSGVGGWKADDSKESFGADYVFRWSGSTWTQEAYIKASNTYAGQSCVAGIAELGQTWNASVDLSMTGYLLGVIVGFITPNELVLHAGQVLLVGSGFL